MISCELNCWQLSSLENAEHSPVGSYSHVACDLTSLQLEELPNSLCLVHIRMDHTAKKRLSLFSKQSEGLSFLCHKIDAADLHIVSPVIEANTPNELSAFCLLKCFEVLGHSECNERD